MVNKILTSSICLLLAACSTNYKPNVHSYGELDRANKTITVDAGNSGLNGSVKRELHKRGWTLKVAESSKTAQTRYTMGLEYWKVDTCVYMGADSEPLFGYDLSVVDNKTGDEVLTMDGKGCEKKTAQSIVDIIEGK